MKKLIIVSFIVGAALMIVATAIADKPDWWAQQEKLSDRIAETQINGQPYPESQMKNSLERRNLKYRLLRFNKPDKIGYVYILSFGKFVGYYVIKGKISSTQSQMTNTTQTWKGGRDDNASMAVNSIGDDGSFGSNEGGDSGVFFFTQTGVLVETDADFLYSDAPLHIDVPNLLKK